MGGQLFARTEAGMIVHAATAVLIAALLQPVPLTNCADDCQLHLSRRLLKPAVEDCAHAHAGLPDQPAPHDSSRCWLSEQRCPVGQAARGQLTFHRIVLLGICVSQRALSVEPAIHPIRLAQTPPACVVQPTPLRI